MDTEIATWSSSAAPLQQASDQAPEPLADRYMVCMCVYIETHLRSTLRDGLVDGFWNKASSGITVSTLISASSAHQSMGRQTVGNRGGKCHTDTIHRGYPLLLSFFRLKPRET